MDEELFERLVLDSFGPSVDDYFYSKIAGAAYPNGDGILRSRLISECGMMELLDFEHEPDNPHDAFAVKVLRRSTGAQLGYLPARTAHDILRRIDPGTLWFAVIKEITENPGTGLTAGANIMVMRWNEAMHDASEEEKRPKSKEERLEAVRKARSERLGRS